MRLNEAESRSYLWSGFQGERHKSTVGKDCNGATAKPVIKIKTTLSLYSELRTLHLQFLEGGMFSAALRADGGRLPDDPAELS